MKRTIRQSSRLLTLLVILFILLPVAFREAPLAQGTMVPLTVRITRVVELDCDEGLTVPCPNDYFSKVNIDSQGLQESNCCAHPEGDPLEFSPNDWVWTRTVDSSRNPIAIQFQLWDFDEFLGFADNELDIANGGNFLDLTFDLNTCKFQGGGLTAPQGGGIASLLQGQSEGSGDDSARIYFTITTPACITQANNVDTDGDGLFNGWEVAGIDGDTPLDGPDFFLNTDPTHKDLFVEVDWMECSATLPAGGCGLGNHSHAPAAGALDDVINAFKNAPIVNHDGKTGITLHLQADEAVGDRVGILFQTNGTGTTDDFNDIKLGNPAGPCAGSFGTAAERSSGSCARILRAKRLAYRYMIFAHSYSESPGSSGIAEVGMTAAPNSVSFGGNDFIVTFGNWSPTSINNNGGQRVIEASTFMHEFGHTLALQHGGGDVINCKPNYLSVMNYTLQFPVADPNRPMDFTSVARGTALASLNESGGLNENAGIGGPSGRLTIYGVNGNRRTAQANAATFDWNEVGGLTNNATADINFIATFQPASNLGGCSTPSPSENLRGFDDWSNIVYNFRNSPLFADGATNNDVGTDLQELTAETMLLVKNPPPDLKAEKSVDKATAVGNDTLNYTVKVTNLEPPKAFNVVVTDTLPDGSTRGWSVGALDQGASNTQTLTFLVPCTAADGAVLTNTASVTGVNELGYADVNVFNNTASVSTSVQAPVLTLTKTATASVNAGEAITYTITYRNTGKGGAANVVITDTLPANVYYSTALDTGAGPKPTTVTVNVDGTRTLTWQVGTLAGGSNAQTIQYKARPTLLALGGTKLNNSARVTFTNANGCTYAPVTASASTVITVVAPTRNPFTLGFWRNHPELWTSEMRARIQATDLRYDVDGNGALSTDEVVAGFAPGGSQPTILRTQLLATFFNLATRRINAGTLIQSKTADGLSLHNVAEAAIYGMSTLALPVSEGTSPLYENATKVLDEINMNKSEVY